MDDNRFYITSEGGFWFVKINDHVFKHGSCEEATTRLVEFFRTTLGRRDFRSVIVSCPQFSVRPEINPEVKTYVGTADELKAQRKAQRDQELIRKAKRALKDLAEAKAGLK